MADEPEICAEPHPDLPVLCEKQTPCFYFHTATHEGVGVVWGECPRPPAKIRGARTALNEMASRAQPAHRAGDPGAAVVRHTVASRVLAEQVVVDPWEEETMEIFRQFLKRRREHFTTPEHLWPLVEAPGEMRKMVRVVQRALRGGWIKEVGAIRLTGVYYTRDHREFRMNKLVPVYESLIGPAPVAQLAEAIASNAIE